MTNLLHVELPCNRDAPCVARDALASVEQIAPICDDAKLVASELVTNAVIHSGCDAEHVIEMIALLDGDALVIKVDDPALAGRLPRMREGSASGLGGFGLRIVEHLARRWGVDHPNGNCVWAELPLRN